MEALCGLTLFQELEPGIYQRAVADKWVFVVPVTAEGRDVTPAFLRRHVLRPKGDAYETLESRPALVRVTEGRVASVDADGAAGEVDIVYTETYYDADYAALRIVNTSHALGSPSSSSSSPGQDAGSSSSMWAQLGSLPAADAAALTLLDGGVAAQLAKRLNKFHQMMASTFGTATLARHGPLVQHSVGFFCKHAWELTNDTVSDFVGAAGSFCAAHHVTRFGLVCAVEGVLMDRLYTVVMPLLCVMHADHDATLSVAAAASAASGQGHAFGVPHNMAACLEEATAALDCIALHTTPLGKLRCVQNCVASIARQARLVKSQATSPVAAVAPTAHAADPERPLSLTADELLPMLINVILRSSVPNLSAHFSYIQFRQDKGSELAYYLTTIRAALEFIRQSASEASDERSPAEGTPGAGGSFAFDPGAVVGGDHAAPRESRLSPELLAESMRSGPAALEVKDRWFRLNRYRQCWVAAECVDWIVQEHKLSRQQATMLGRSMLMQGLIRHVADADRDFEDDYLFFVWVERKIASHGHQQRLLEPSEKELSEKGGSSVVAQVLAEVAQLRNQKRAEWSAAKQLVYEMSDPVSGVEVRDQVPAFAMFERSCERCFSQHEGVAWLQRSKRMTAAEASDTLAALAELKLLVVLSGGRSDPQQNFLQLAPLAGHPSEGTALVQLVLTADVPLTRRSTLLSECWCFAGATLLDWLLDKRKARSRAEGIVLGRRLQNAGLLARVGRDGLFVDSPSTFFVWKLGGLTKP